MSCAVRALSSGVPQRATDDIRVSQIKGVSADAPPQTCILHLNPSLATSSAIHKTNIGGSISCSNVRIEQTYTYTDIVQLTKVSSVLVLSFHQPSRTPSAAYDSNMQSATYYITIHVCT